MAKRTNIEIEASLMQVQGWIIEGVSSGEIVRKIIGNGWCTSTRHAANLIKVAKDRWVDETNVATKMKRAVKVKELEALRNGLAQRFKGTPQGLMAVVRIEEMIIKLQGLNATTTVERTKAKEVPKQVPVYTGIDYTKLSTSALREIAAARLPAPDNEGTGNRGAPSAGRERRH